jgi:hypothetical protein
MDLIRDREETGHPHRKDYLHPSKRGAGLEVILPPKR